MEESEFAIMCSLCNDMVGFRRERKFSVVGEIKKLEGLVQYLSSKGVEAEVAKVPAVGFLGRKAMYTSVRLTGQTIDTIRVEAYGHDYLTGGGGDLYVGSSLTFDTILRKEVK